MLRRVPGPVDLALLLAGVILASLFTALCGRRRAAVAIAGLLIIFYLAAAKLFCSDYIINYASFPAAVIICPAAADRLRGFLKNTFG